MKLYVWINESYLTQSLLYLSKAWFHFKYPIFGYIRCVLTEKKVKFVKKNMPSDLYDVNAKFEFEFEFEFIIEFYIR